MNALIGLPLCDLRHLPINLLPFDRVTRKSFEVMLKTTPNIQKVNNRFTPTREVILK